MTLLELRGIGMEYGAIRALAEVDYTVASGEIVGLIGDNGAGKSTLVKIIAGNFPPTHGTMHFDGREVRFRGPEGARNAGIEVVYQDLALADNLSGAANVFLGRELRRRVAGFRIMDHAAMTRRAAQLFAELKSETRPEAPVRTLSGGQRQAVAIARTRLAAAQLVLLDEPTASISVRQVAEVLDLMRRMRDHGQSVIFISHAMPHIFAVADRITVLRRGQKVADKPVGATSPEEVTALITGAVERA
jgi:simple sugar transport system ATP-binding protein